MSRTRKKRPSIPKKPGKEARSKPPCQAAARQYPLWTYAAVFILLAVVSFVLYYKILHAPFVFDDTINIRDKAGVHVKTISELFGVFFDETIEKRRIGYFTFALNFLISGLDTFGYHLTNVLIHILSGCLIFWLVLITLTLPNTERASIFEKTGNNGRSLIFVLAFFAALIWLVHPVQTQAVSYIVQRFASLAALFFLSSFAFYIAGRLRTGKYKYVLFAASALCGILAMGVKQNTAVLPFLIFVYELYFFHDSPWDTLKKRWAMGAGLLIFLASITLLYLGPGLWTILKEGFELRPFTMTERLITESRVILYYLSLIVLPLPSRLNVDYDFAFSKSIFDPLTTFLSIILIVGVLIFALARAKKQPLLSFSILWFFGHLVIESSILPLDLVHEHRLYLASLGPITLITAFVILKTRTRNMYAAPVILALIVIVFGVWTYERNEVWTSPVKLWTDCADKSPNKARVHGNLGKALLDAGRYKAAAREFETSLRLDPSLLGAYNNLAVIYIDHLKQYDKAAKHLHEAIKRNPSYPSAYLNLGVIALNKRQILKAIPYFQKTLALDPKNLGAHYNLAACYVNLRDFAQALKVLNQGLALWPASHRLYLLRGRVHHMAGERNKARIDLKKAYSLAPSNPEVRHYFHALR